MQEIKVKSIINKIMENDKIPHAILLEKSYGYNLTDIEEIILRRIFNKTSVTIDTEAAVLKIEGKKIDRELLDKIQTSFSTTSINNFDSKVIIIDNFEETSIQISNAMLKLIEEPQPNRFIILNTKNINALPKTIVSRCQKYKISSEFDYIWTNDDEKKYFDILCQNLMTSAIEFKDLLPFLIETLDKNTYKWKLQVFKRTLFSIWSSENEMPLKLLDSDHKIIISLIPYISFSDITFEHLIETINIFLSTKTLNFEVAFANFLMGFDSTGRPYE